jgi:hypothetical protein
VVATEARATFERLGEASGQYALERGDGSRTAIVYRVLANAPLPGLNLMAIDSSDAEVASDLARIRRVGDDVHVGLDASDDERWFGSGARLLRRTKPSARTDEGSVVAAVFRTEEDAWAALLALQPTVDWRHQVALSSFDGGWPRDQRSVLAVRGPEDQFLSLAAIVARFGGVLLAGGRPTTTLAPTLTDA